VAARFCHGDRVQRLRFVMMSAALLAGCGGSKTTTTSPDMAAGDMSSGPVIVGQHGRLIDYFNGMPLAGLTVADGTNSVTTDAAGGFVLPGPMGQLLKPAASGSGYATLYLPEAMAAAVDVDRGDVPMASTSTFSLEQQILANDTTKALVHILLAKSGACASFAGGTITVNSPAGAQVAYFTTQALPTALTMSDIVAPKPVAVIYDVDAGTTLDLTINVPGCTQMPAGAVLNGMALTGTVTTMATEPGDNAAALTFVMQ
jgi:hypothetical protein